MPGDLPAGWRDVYALVRDTRNDLRSDVAEVADAVRGLQAKFDTHMLEHAQTGGQQNRSSTRWAYARVFIQTVLPVPAAIIAVVALLQGH